MINRKALCKVLAIGFGTIILSSNAHALSINAENSSVFLVATKIVEDGSTSVTETFSLPGLSGDVSDDMEATVKIDLSSIATGIEKRDNRMREHLFKVTEYPDAIIIADVPEFTLKNGLHRVDLDITLELHDEIQDLVVPVLVATTNSTIVVSSQMPVLLDAFDFSMVDGLEKLAELAKLLHIPTTVPVSFSIQFDR